MMGVESLPVQSWIAIVVELSQPRISNTTPWGAAVVNSRVRKLGALVCRNWPMRRLVGRREEGRSGIGVMGLSERRRCLIPGDHLAVWRWKASDTVYTLCAESASLKWVLE